MDTVLALAHLVLFLLLVALLARLVLDWLQMLARGWRPRGLTLVAAEGVYSVTDPPLRGLRRVVPPLTLGGVQIDLAFIILFLAVTGLMRLTLLL